MTLVWPRAWAEASDTAPANPSILRALRHAFIFYCDGLAERLLHAGSLFCGKLSLCRRHFVSIAFLPKWPPKTPLTGNLFVAFRCGLCAALLPHLSECT